MQEVLTEEARVWSDKFTKELQSELGIELSKMIASPANAEILKNVAIDIIKKYSLEQNGSEDITAVTLWNTMSLWKKTIWKVMRIWPFKIHADAVRREINRLNADKWHRDKDSLTHSYEPMIEYPNIYNPSPKSTILITMPITVESINSVEVSGVISV